MSLTQNQIEVLKGKCPKCDGYGAIVPYMECKSCNGLGKATIEIEKECKCGHSIYNHMVKEDCEYDNCDCIIFIPKYKVNDEICIAHNHISYCEVYSDLCKKLKIISETEDKWRVVMV